MEVSRKERGTFYDSAYIFAAQKEGLALITEDDKLSKIAKKYVATKHVSSLF